MSIEKEIRHEFLYGAFATLKVDTEAWTGTASF
jgi:hypothetical protein